MSSENNIYKIFKEWCELHKGQGIIHFEEDEDGSLIFTKEEFENIYSIFGGNPDQLKWRNKDKVTHVRFDSIEVSKDGSQFDLNFSIGSYLDEIQQTIIIEKDEISTTDN